jgi:folate-dependent tRNA-U54 methylase TrmFO/GidA
VESEPNHFAPMNSNWGIVPELEGPPIRDKREKARQKGVRALNAFTEFIRSLDEIPVLPV